MKFIIIFLFLLTGCIKKENPAELKARSYDIEWSDEDEELEDLPEDTGD